MQYDIVYFLNCHYF